MKLFNKFSLEDLLIKFFALETKESKWIDPFEGFTKGKGKNIYKKNKNDYKNKKSG